MKDGGRDGVLKDLAAEEGVVVEFRVAFLTDPGKYVLRVLPGRDRLPREVVLEIAPRSPTFWGWLNETVTRAPEIINDPGPSLERVRAVPNLKAIGKADLWLLGVRDKENPRPLTDSGDCFNPSWSPDGGQIAYIRRPGEKGRLWVLRIGENGAAAAPRRLAAGHGGDIRNPVWSPKGDSIAFLSRDESDNDLWVLDVGGAKRNRITTGARIRRILAWAGKDHT